MLFCISSSLLKAGGRVLWGRGARKDLLFKSSGQAEPQGHLVLTA